MKAYILIPFALLLGLVLGGWGPRSELKTAHDELKKTRRLLKDVNAGRGGSDVGRVTQLLGIDERAQNAHPDKKIRPAPEEGKQESQAADRAPAVPRADTDVSQPEAGETRSSESGNSGEQNPDQGSGMQRNIDDAIELWKLRSDIARSTFLANGRFSEEDAVDFDVLVEAMNVRLRHSIESWSDAVKEKEKAGAEEGIRLVNEVTDVLVLTYDEMDRKLPENWRDTGGKGLHLGDFIDPSIAKPLIKVEDKLDTISRDLESD